MDPNSLLNGLLHYLYFIILLTFHEFAHAWTAWKLGDRTARDLGRISLNPITHIDPLGTVVIPLIAIAISSSASGGGYFFGWAKPVPVDRHAFRHPRLHDSLVTAAGPLMNLLLAFVLVLGAKAGLVAGAPKVVGVLMDMAFFSTLLCFFNLLPVPPLDGSHLLKNAIRMSEEAYLRYSQYGFFIIFVVMQIPQVQHVLYFAVQLTMLILTTLVGMKGD